jgi:hypothetical protein
LRQRYLQAEEVERHGISELRKILRERLCGLRKAENIRKKRKEKSKTRLKFIRNPYQFSSTLLEGERGGVLKSSKEEIEQYLSETHSDQRRNEPLGEQENISPVDPPKVDISVKEPTWHEVKEIISKARNKSSPGPNGVPYKVYKMCPLLAKRLWKLLRIVWRSGKIPACWRRAEGIFIPKEKESKNIKQFRTISLLNVEGKIFFSVLARRMTAYMTANEYIDTSVQKGGVPGFSGCVEHISAITQLVREAKINNNSLTVVWLDLANAYGSLPHQLIFKALNHYFVPEHIQNMIKSYYSDVCLRFTTPECTTRWQPLQKGIVTGCTISVILFVMGMNLIIKTAEKESRGPLSATGIRQPSSRGFMDDMTITTSTQVQARWILAALSRLVEWARMSFKAEKSRSLIIVKGKVNSRYELKVQNQSIPSITERPVKCLGKWFDASLKDTEQVKQLKTKVQDGLRKIDKTGLPGKFKCWMYQHSLLPRLTWPLMLYEVATTVVENLERIVNKSLRRWLGVPPSFTSIGLYSSSTAVQLPLTSLVEEFKVAKARLVMTLRDSKDDKIRRAGIEIRTGRKWSASSAVLEAESRLQHRDIIGTTTTGRQGLGMVTRQRWAAANQAEKRKLVQDDIRKQENEGREAKSVQLGCQGAWTRWDTDPRKLSWSEIWRMEPLRIQFLLRSVYDLLPTPANLCRWGLTESALCPLCDKTGTLRHVLSACQVALSQGRYGWRHDKVLMELADILERVRQTKRDPGGPKANMISFVKTGEKKKATNLKQQERSSNILDGTCKWEMRADLGRRLEFPSIVTTNLRPDIVLWSESGKKLIMVELTVPWEEAFDEANERKRARYAELEELVRGKGWSAWTFPVEIGARGFPGRSVYRLLTALGVRGRDLRDAVRRLGDTAERTSCWLWWKRNQSSWKPSSDGQ